MDINRKPSRAWMLQFTTHFVGAACATAFGIAIGFHLDEPKPIIRTVMLEVPPACREVGPSVQAERATAAKLAEAHELALELSEAYGPAVLSTDPDEIEKAAKALDTALRDEQALILDLATAQATTDTVSSNCTPERDQ